jgi:phospholipase/lecithinase/hemolysin
MNFSAPAMFRVLLRTAFCLALPLAATAQPVDKLFAFGDSYTDSGAGYVDGNGPTAIVYVAQDLGLPFTHAADPQGAGKGLNFAVSGARTGEGEGRRVKGALLGYGMQNQVRDFAARVEKGEIAFDPARTVFFIAGGLNDRTLTTEVTVANLTEVVRGLYAAGARKFLVAVMPEKIPDFAEVGRRLNPALARLPGELQAAFPDAEIRSSGWGRYFDAVMEAPAKYGISNTTEACAERWIFDQDPTPRGNPATYYYYHPGHPSTTVQRHVANELKREILALVGR